LRAKWFIVLTMGLMLFSLAIGVSLAEEKAKVQGKQESSLSMLTKGMTTRLASNLHVKNIVGDPIKVGKVTIIPIIMIDIGFGGGGGGPSGSQTMGGSGFGMGGEVKPLGFIIISKKETRFVSVGKIPRK